jgi:hypothetical protein
MKDHQSDFEELQPLGEATSIPDVELVGRDDNKPVDDSTTEYPPGYPDEIDPTESECASCGISIPGTQTKCEFCLTYHLDGSDDEQNHSTDESTLLHVVHFLVEASTFYAGVAKGSAAATLLSKPDKDPVVDECLMTTISMRNLRCSWLTAGPRFPKQYELGLKRVDSCSLLLVIGLCGQTNRSRLVRSDMGRFYTMRPDIRFLRRISLRAT